MHVAFLLSLTIWCGDGDPQIAVEEVYRSYDYQAQLHPEERPGRATDGGTGTGDGRRWTVEEWEAEMRRRDARWRRLPKERGSRERRRPPPERIEGPSGGTALGGLLELLVWVGLGVALVTIIASIVRGWGRRQKTVQASVLAREEAAPASLEAPRTAAELLADEGRYAEAIHLLLLKTIEALVAARPEALPEAWTSREIQMGAAMPDPARAPFGVLVDAVEASLFAGREVGVEDWEACTARFREFESAYRAAHA